ncbi:type II secretion system F family protein [Streptomyces rubiginosohelvolus]|uniref:type II secretion system F family protein n=1 Tax=Streptomyces rubiginosohelvolus TaxID=67362 RepID=UPI0036E48F49
MAMAMTTTAAAVTSAYGAHAVALCAGSAVWLAMTRDPGVRRARVLFVNAPPEPRRTWGRSLRLVEAWGRLTEGARKRREWWCVPGAVVLAVLGSSVLPLVAGAMAVPLVRRWLLRRAGAQQAERGAIAVAALCGAVVGELRAGREPGQALLVALREGLAEDGSAAAGASGSRLGEAEAAVLAAARFGGDVPAALRQAAESPGMGGLSGMAACWRVAVDGGAGLATGLERLEAALREDRRRREELRAQLAGAWSTVVVLALLPVAGLGLGAALGAEPLRVLLHTPGGLACLAVGSFLEAAGLYWARRIVRGGEAA